LIQPPLQQLHIGKVKNDFNIVFGKFIGLFKKYFGCAVPFGLQLFFSLLKIISCTIGVNLRIRNRTKHKNKGNDTGYCFHGWIFYMELKNRSFTLTLYLPTVEGV